MHMVIRTYSRVGITFRITISRALDELGFVGHRFTLWVFSDDSCLRGNVNLSR